MALGFRKAASVIFLTLLLGAFQNCDNAKSFSSNDKHQASMSGNGGSYDGKPKVLRNFDVANSCTTLDRNGKPLPNNVIVIKPDATGKVAPYLARKNCVDIEPVAIDGSLTWSSADTVIYNGQSFDTQKPPGDFDVFTPVCPGGKTVKSGAIMTNEFASSLNWTAPPWNIYQGIGVSLYGTIASLPSFQLLRNDPGALDYWRRDDQVLSLKPSTEYTFAFAAQPGTIPAADVNYFRNVSGSTGTTSNPLDESAVITCDFQTMSTNIVYSQNIANLSAEVTRLGNGFICTIHFTSSANADQLPLTSIGVGPSVAYGSPKVGDSVIVTGAQLVPVNQFCQ